MPPPAQEDHPDDRKVRAVFLHNESANGPERIVARAFEIADGIALGHKPWDE